MIPKIIHYCWFSKDPYPDIIQKCIISWHKFSPDYSFHLWDENSFDFDSVSYVKEAMSVKQYAGAADYIRLYALYTEGGIYLDSDVEIFHPLDKFIQTNFIGSEVSGKDLSIINLEAGIMGFEKGHPFLKAALDYYHQIHFINSDGTYHIHSCPMPKTLGMIAERWDYKHNNTIQHLRNDITIYSTKYFVNSAYYWQHLNHDYYAIHHNTASWMTYEWRGPLFHYCKKRNLMRIYHIIERIIRILNHATSLKHMFNNL